MTDDLFGPLPEPGPGPETFLAGWTHVIDQQAARAREVQETSQTVAAGQLRAFIERIEQLEEEKKTIGDDIKDVYAELKGTGFDTKAVRAIITLRRLDPNQRQEFESILDLYKAALGIA